MAGCDALTMATLYNLRARRAECGPFDPDEKRSADGAKVGILAHLHERLDRAVQAAFGWDDRPDAETMLDRLKRLNAQRTLEEGRGQVRYLRPAYQQGRRSQATPVQYEADLKSPPARRIGPRSPERLGNEVLTALRRGDRPVPTGELIGRLGSRRTGGLTRRVEDMLAILSAAGAVRQTEAGWYAPRHPD